MSCRHTGPERTLHSCGEDSTPGSVNCISITTTQFTALLCQCTPAKNVKEDCESRRHRHRSCEGPFTHMLQDFNPIGWK